MSNIRVKIEENESRESAKEADKTIDDLHEESRQSALAILNPDILKLTMKTLSPMLLHTRKEITHCNEINDTIFAI
jgi:hypothetical protein